MDFYLDAIVVGPNLVVNGDFSVDASGWTPNNATLSRDNNTLKVLATSLSSPNGHQAITTLTVGKKYRFRASQRPGNTDNKARVELTGTALAAPITYAYDVIGANIDYTFTAAGTTLNVACAIANSLTVGLSGNYSVFDDISLYEVQDQVYHFCDDVVDVTDGTTVWIGANPLANSIEVKSGRDLSAESVTLVLDGDRMAQAGIHDPARVLRDILDFLFQQRRVDCKWGFSYPDTAAIQLIVPVAALKINTCRLVDEKLEWGDPTKAPTSKLEIVLDSLAMRYNRATYRTRSHTDQLEIDPSDAFFSFTADAANTEKTLYWGKRSPTLSAVGGGGGGGSYGGFSFPHSY